jgi:RNA polymerase sigma factor (sigma-70 family)
MSDEPLASVYRRHGPSVFRRARRILGLEADAQEVVQEVFLSLLEKPDQFRGTSSLTTFLYSATTHACLNRLRNSRNRERLEREHFAGAEDETAGPALSAEQRVMLQRALSTMPEQLAQAAVYYLVDGLTQDEIARLLSCSRRHVGHLLGRLANVAEGQGESAC